MRRTLHGAPETVNLSTTSTARAARLCGGDAMGMVMHLRRIALGAGALALTLAATAAKADPIPPGGQGEHVRVIGFSGLGGHFGGFKIAIKHTAGDKWYLFTGHSFNQGWSIVDVTDPANPRYVKFIPFATDDKSIITSQVTLHDNLMLTSLNSFEPQKNPLPAVLLWDISDPRTRNRSGLGKAASPARIAIPTRAANTPISRPAIPGSRPISWWCSTSATRRTPRTSANGGSPARKTASRRRPIPKASTDRSI
jgi:hypothetical protein